MAKYIIDKRLKFRKGLQSEFINTIKKNTKLTWKQLSDKLNVSVYTIEIAWGLERTTIPKTKAIELLKLSPFISKGDFMNKFVEIVLPPKWGQQKGGRNSLLRHSKEIILPEIDDSRFAEFLGILLGDGHTSKKGIEISIEYPLESDYAIYIQNLIDSIFGRKPIIRFKKSSKHTVYLILNSVSLVSFLNSVGIKTGNKIKNRVNIPKFIMNDFRLLRPCIRGLIDTDGGIFEKQKNYKRALIEFKSFCKPLKDSTRKGLMLLGFKVSKGGPKSIRIQNQEEIFRYFKEIGFSNKKNLVRFEYFSKFGTVPKRNELFNILSSGCSLSEGHKY